MYSLVVAWQFLVPSRRTLERSRCPFRQSLTLWARARARSYERVVAVWYPFFSDFTFQLPCQLLVFCVSMTGFSCPVLVKPYL